MNNRDLFDKFTERARMVMTLAQEEAQHFQHNTIGTEHLLLGLVREGESIAAQVLESLGVTLEQVRKAVEETKGRGNGKVQGEIVLSPHANTAIEMAMKEANRRYPPHTTDTGRRLLGSITMPKSDALNILQDLKMPPHLESLGVTLEQVRKAVEETKGRGVQIVTEMTPLVNTVSGEADRQHHPLFFIDTENLLLGLIRVPESTAVQILQALGAPPLKDFWSLVFLEHVTTLQTTNQGYSQRFTRQARKAWGLAHEEARRLQDTYVGVHHLLLGLVSEGSGVAATVLADMRVKLAEMREDVERISIGGGDGIAPGDIGLQPYLKNVIELASNEARRLHHPSIGTGHLLLVMARNGEGQGIEAGLLKSQGVDLDKMRTATWRTLTEKAGESGQEAASVTDEISEEGFSASIASIERDLQSRELDKTILAVYPFAIEARKVLEDARIEAKRLAQRVGPEHLLVGLASLTFRHDGPVSKALKDVGIDFAGMQAAVENR
ncbi:MAG TPA: Clp protease N-terminal domain-containing protein, partial [Ktedonobacteraceae bacterium]|nr:Clp protease N-terminal domain-containing protein [Ktedonobacteraceae bacterium]